MRRTKIVCTIGPQSWDQEVLAELVKDGMDVARINFSHGDFASHHRVIDHIRTRYKGLVPIMLDTRGPELRAGALRDNLSAVKMEKGDVVKLWLDAAVKGDAHNLGCNLTSLDGLHQGCMIMIGDGNLQLEVTSIHDKYVEVKVCNDATIGSYKNMAIPGVKMEGCALGDFEKNALSEFAKKVDIVAISHTKTRRDVEDFRAILTGVCKPRLFAKVEDQEALEVLDEIIQAADGVMIDRGDLGMSAGSRETWRLQKDIVNCCRAKGRTVIVGTQLLESLITKSWPSRAEVSDIANAIFDGCDALQLSGETASGQFPGLALRTMSDICVSAERSLDRIPDLSPDPFRRMDRVCRAAVVMSGDADVIIVTECSDDVVFIISSLRPAVPIIVLDDKNDVSFKFACTWGTKVVGGTNVVRKSECDIKALFLEIAKMTLGFRVERGVVISRNCCIELCEV